MPRINIHEHSDTYSYQTRPDVFGTVALPITAIWGPTYDPTDEDANPDWVRFEGGYKGTQKFVQTFRGANTALGVRDKSYEYALKLLACGYDVLAKRCDNFGKRSCTDLFLTQTTQGKKARGVWYFPSAGENCDAEHCGDPQCKGSTAQGFEATARFAGAAGNNLKVRLERLTSPVYNPLKGGKVTSYMYVYYVDGNDEILLEKTRLSYFQQPGTKSGESVTFNTDVIQTTESSYIEKLRCRGWGNAHGNGATMLGVHGRGDHCNDCPFKTEETSNDEQFGCYDGTDPENVTKLRLRAKYPGTFGNQLKVRIKTDYNSYGKAIGVVEVFDRNGVLANADRIVPSDSLLEQVDVAFDIEGATDTRPLITEATFNYLTTITALNLKDVPIGTSFVASLTNGTDIPQVLESDINTNDDPNYTGVIKPEAVTQQVIIPLVQERFDNKECSFVRYLRAVLPVPCEACEEECDGVCANCESKEQCEKCKEDGKIACGEILPVSERVKIYCNQRAMHNAMLMIPELTDPIVYDWDVVFNGIQDDQYIPKSWLDTHPDFELSYEVTRMHYILIETAANSKCGCAFIGTPFGMKRGTWDSVNNFATGAVLFKNELSAYVDKTYSTFGEVVGPWCRTTLPISGINSWCTPEVAHLLLIIKNNSQQEGLHYWWLPPAGMIGDGTVHSPEYKIKRAYMDIIQNHDEGVCLNPLMQVPGKGFTCFGNSTLWDKPLGTYNALQNLSTRFLCNRVKQRIWDSALEILFRYNNQDAYTHFYALLSPLLDTMRNAGALNATDANPLGYRIIMNPDIVNLDHINANTVIGRVELAVQGVIDTVDVDLFLLPPNYFEEQGNF